MRDKIPAYDTSRSLRINRIFSLHLQCSQAMLECGPRSTLHLYLYNLCSPEVDLHHTYREPTSSAQADRLLKAFHFSKWPAIRMVQDPWLEIYGFQIDKYLTLCENKIFLDIVLAPMIMPTNCYLSKDSYQNEDLLRFTRTCIRFEPSAVRLTRICGNTHHRDFMSKGVASNDANNNTRAKAIHHSQYQPRMKIISTSHRAPNPRSMRVMKSFKGYFQRPRIRTRSEYWLPEVGDGDILSLLTTSQMHLTSRDPSVTNQYPDNSCLPGHLVTVRKRDNSKQIRMKGQNMPRKWLKLLNSKISLNYMYVLSYYGGVKGKTDHVKQRGLVFVQYGFVTFFFHSDKAVYITTDMSFDVQSLLEKHKRSKCFKYSTTGLDMNSILPPAWKSILAISFSPNYGMQFHYYLPHISDSVTDYYTEKSWVAYDVYDEKEERTPFLSRIWSCPSFMTATFQFYPSFVELSKQLSTKKSSSIETMIKGAKLAKNKEGEGVSTREACVGVVEEN
ncbi:uncharacterized protein BDR25DRAFT_355157 [Lindgomyces ingoldianus]|uniref:Uncharacterized protein n=1 Tax=Lindgomyces ingoldianus TaxID=673940 RepID=A0ACB6QUS4_9PLEO|nr:uncharacterized protein BDR25DRAFT_355157 [Lindgomyces ingoldianus]KAF2470686.1 hypothetical protein BDR25DRAFT_355157 [Lindgomyces ingoldianus]